MTRHGRSRCCAVCRSEASAGGAARPRIEELFLLVTGGDGDVRRDAFDDLVVLLSIHETAEEEVIHPLARELPGGGG